uniref:Uncharacterized protein n=1 Tax=Macaca mulatta TaxID=9544 RepID=A0A5F8AS35_MACMU
MLLPNHVLYTFQSLTSYVSFFSFFLFFFFIWGVTLLRRLQSSGVITVHCSLDLPSSSDPPALAFQAARTTGMHHHTRLSFFKFFLRDGASICCLGYPKLLVSSNSPALASRSTGITGVSHLTQLQLCFDTVLLCPHPNLILNCNL